MTRGKAAMMYKHVFEYNMTELNAKARYPRGQAEFSTLIERKK